MDNLGHFRVYNKFRHSPAPFVASHPKKHRTRKIVMDFVSSAVEYGRCFVFITCAVNILFSVHAVNEKKLKDSMQLNFAQEIS